MPLERIGRLALRVEEAEVILHVLLQVHLLGWRGSENVLVQIVGSPFNVNGALPFIIQRWQRVLPITKVVIDRVAVRHIIRWPHWRLT